MRQIRSTVPRLFLAVALVAVAQTAWAGAEDWNDAQIRWLPYEQGLQDAKQSQRPICLVFYTTWCPHCANYAKVFANPEVVDKARAFVMIRIDADKNKELSEQYKPDGAYIPRTYFLSADGKLDESISENRDKFKYFYDEASPKGILGGMQRALQKLKKS